MSNIIMKIYPPYKMLNMKIKLFSNQELTNVVKGTEYNIIVQYELPDESREDKKARLLKYFEKQLDEIMPKYNEHCLEKGVI